MMDKFESQEEEILFLRSKNADLEGQIAKISSAPQVMKIDIPEDFVKRDFAEFNNEVSSMGKAKSIRTPELSEVDMTHFEGCDVMEKFIVLASVHREHNRSNEDVLKMKQGKISRSTSSRANEVQNTLRVFFGFCQRMFGKADFRHLLEESVITAFPRWYKQMGRQPSSIANHMKIIKSFLKFVSGHQVFFNYLTKINSVIETIKPIQAVFSKLANSAKYMLTDEKMRCLGIWLTEPEFLLLNKFACDFLSRKFEADADFVRGKTKSTKLSRADVALLMDHVYLLGLMYLGGQRNQFVASLSIKNVVFQGSLTKYLKTHEKVNRQKVDYFKFPLTFSVMIRVWMTRYLPLVRAEGVEACWVSSTGKAYSHSKMGDRIAPLVASYFPGRRITPIYFRRAIVTFIKGKSYGPDATGIDAFFKERLAVLMNTSPDIIDLNYDRLHRADVNEETLRQVNNGVGLFPTGALADLIEELAKDYDEQAEGDKDGALRILSHEFVSQYDPRFTVEFDDGTSKVLPWTEMTPLLHLVDVYWAKIGGPGEAVPKPKLPSKWGKTSPIKVKSAKAEPVKSPPASPEKKKLHVDEGDVNDDFGLDPLPESPSVEEDPVELDLLTMVDGSLSKIEEFRAVTSKSSSPAKTVAGRDPSSPLKTSDTSRPPSPFKTKQVSLLEAFGKQGRSPTGPCVPPESPKKRKALDEIELQRKKAKVL